MVRKLAALAMAVLLVGGVGFASVTKSTATDPTSFSSSVSGSTIGVAVGLKGPAGPGVYASTTAGALSVLSGSLSKSTEASVKVSYDNPSGGVFLRAVTAVVVGFSFSFAKSFSLWIISGGTMTSKNKLEWTMIEDEDGVVQVVMGGSAQTSVTTGGSSSTQYKPVFKFYAGLLFASSNASLKSKVKSSSSITATPLSTGVANGQVATWILGIP